ncbi:hypothetical protein [Streptococcus porcinus]|uniref:Capsular polysaccharide biosynthesis protein Cps4G n=1 Tax=Streptococcus porcinus TaxID=1340 RepID=A0A4V0H295_STRPO|nr:hypothetical protein [Streptococcus porcinus]VTT43221.1 capsular polysaccharide biosynthesis protein Cps4G [Streptococcus porcinus]VTT44719.1 capsular polysaccharide biosynthesis protein Cps4G [Streptococcus porcinus]
MKKQKKICIVTMGNIYLVPYLQTYINKINSPTTIIYWDRDNLDEKDDNNVYYRFQYKLDSKKDKILGYIKYRKFVKNILLKNDFDIVILAQTLSALLLNDVLIKHYKKKYIVDVRDYSYENNKLIYNIEKKLLKNSAMNVVSSEGFLNFLPTEAEYEVAHNIRKWPETELENISNREKQREKLNIAFIGYISYQEQHKKLLLALKNDKRFNVNFIGSKSLDLLAFCKENNINNVTLIDTFKTEKTLDFYKNVDLVNNLYGNHTPVLDYALSNKLYYAATLNIPILVCEETFMEDITHKYHFGITVDLDNSQNLGDYLFESYQNIDWDKLDSGTSDFIRHVESQQSQFEEKLFKLLN